MGLCVFILFTHYAICSSNTAPTKSNVNCQYSSVRFQNNKSLSILENTTLVIYKNQQLLSLIVTQWVLKKR